MKKSLTTVAIILTAVLVSMLIASSASAGPEPTQTGSGLTDPVLLALLTNDDLFATIDLSTLLHPPAGTGTPTQHYGPYPSESPDSGTCGNDWANDMFDRHFTVRTSSSGAITVVEQFKNGSFVTSAGFSPGGCQPTPPPQGTVDANKTGSMHGYFIIPLPPGEVQTSHSPYCDATGMTNTDCTTTAFIDSHFTPCYFAGSGTCSVTTFFFHYSAGDQNLIQHEWKNASDDRGGNSGDIRSANL